MADCALKRLLALLDDEEAGLPVDRDQIRHLAAGLVKDDPEMRAVFQEICARMGEGDAVTRGG